MLWEVEIHPLGRDGERDRVCDEFDLLTSSKRGADLVTASSRGYLIDGHLADVDVQNLCDELLVDRLVERFDVRELGTPLGTPATTVLLKPGVTSTSPTALPPPRPTSATPSRRPAPSAATTAPTPTPPTAT